MKLSSWINVETDLSLPLLRSRGANVPPSFGILPKSISSQTVKCDRRSLTTTTSGPATRYAFMFWTSLQITSPCSSTENRRRRFSGWRAIPTMATVTPALLLARFAHLNDWYRQTKSHASSSNINGHSIATCRPWHIEFVETNAAAGCRLLTIVCGFHEPSPNIIDGSPVFGATFKDAFLSRSFWTASVPLASLVRRIPADKRLPALILKIDFRLIERRAE